MAATCAHGSKARAQARGFADCVHRRGNVLQLRRDTGGRWLPWIDDGSALRADEVPAVPLGAMHSLARSGVLEVHAGRVEEVSPADDAVEVIWRPRGAQRTRAWLVDRVINCTGPGRVGAHADPLVQSLLANGLIRPDALGLGIDVADDGRPIAGDGQPVDSLYYIGPWLRARDWEATAVPELRERAVRLAETLVARILRSAAARGA
jgi:uncharacterized NAD(P)/FAD-binding protein YdhS